MSYHYSLRSVPTPSFKMQNTKVDLRFEKNDELKSFEFRSKSLSVQKYKTQRPTYLIQIDLVPLLFTAGANK